MEDVYVLIERVEQRAKSNTHQIQEIKEEMKELKDENKAIYKIATSVEVIAEKLGSIEDKVDDTVAAQKRTEEGQYALMQKINEVERRPDLKKSEGLDKIKISVITAVCTSVTVAVVCAVLQLTFGG